MSSSPSSPPRSRSITFTYPRIIYTGAIFSILAFLCILAGLHAPLWCWGVIVVVHLAVCWMLSRVRTVVDPQGITVRTITSSAYYPWDVVRGLELSDKLKVYIFIAPQTKRNSSSQLEHSSHSSVIDQKKAQYISDHSVRIALPAVGVNDLDDIALFSRGRIARGLSNYALEDKTT